MSARESAAVERAAAAVMAGATIADAARVHGVARSSIHRAINRRAVASASPLGDAVGPGNVGRVL